MKIINELIPETVAYALGWTVLHSLWQGLVIALLLFLGLHLLKNKSPKWQYEASCFALFSVLITALATFIFYFDTVLTIGRDKACLVPTNGQNLLSETGEIVLMDAQLTANINSVSMFEQYLPWVVSFWLIGVVVLTIRFFANFLYLHHFRKQTLPLGDAWQKKIEGMRQKMKISHPVQLAESALAKTPMTLGFLKPIIIFPIGTLNQLNPAETEAILAHELAHIFRNDYLQNIFISIIEILFYYHPAVWWISSRIHGLRENCCDDMAIKICGDSVTYVKALVKLEDLKTLPAPQLAMSFSGRKNTLLLRVKRILNQGQPKSDFMEKIAATCLIAMLIFGLTVSANNNNETLALSETDCEVVMEKDTEEPCLENDKTKVIALAKKMKARDEGADKENVLVVTYKTDTIPAEKPEEPSGGYTIVESEKDNQDVTVEIRNGEIVMLKVDDKEIAKEDFSKYKELTDPILENINEKREHIVFSEDDEGFVFKEYNNGRTRVFISGGAGEEDDVEVVVDGDYKIIINGEEVDLPDHVFKSDGRFEFNSADFDFDVPDFEFDADNFDFDFDMEDFKARFDVEGFQEKIANVEDLLGEEEERIQGMLDEIEVEHLVDIERITAEMEERLLEMKEQLAAEEAHREAKIEEMRAEMEIQAEAVRMANEQLQELEKKEERDDKIAKALEQELLRDGLIEDDGNYSIQLNHKRMKVNGEKQSEDMRKKYISIIEGAVGKTVDRKFTYSMRKRTKE